MTPGLIAFKANVRAAMEAAYGRLTWEDIAAIVAGHPRIGERSGTSEQAGVTDYTRPGLGAANRACERRFGHGEETERRVVTRELLKIALLRAERLLA